MQTDRQTDKATCWSVTAFKDPDMTILLEKKDVPDFVKEIAGGLEECPETGRPHFQGFLLLRTQQRMSALKKWLPTSHLEVCRKGAAALKNYAMKSDTAIGEKTEWSNPQQYEQLHEWLLKAAKEYVRTEDAYYSGLKDAPVQPKDPHRDTYIWATSKLIAEDISMLNKYSNPQFIAAWRMYAPVIIAKARQLVREADQVASEGHSITPSGQEEKELVFISPA